MRGRREPRTWAATYRELCAIDELAQAIFADWKVQIEEAVSQASCCLTIAEILRDFRARAWQQAVREHDRGDLARGNRGQLKLF